MPPRRNKVKITQHDASKNDETNNNEIEMGVSDAETNEQDEQTHQGHQASSSFPTQHTVIDRSAKYRKQANAGYRRDVKQVIKLCDMHSASREVVDALTDIAADVASRLRISAGEARMRRKTHTMKIIDGEFALKDVFGTVSLVPKLHALAMETLKEYDELQTQIHNNNNNKTPDTSVHVDEEQQSRDEIDDSCSKPITGKGKMNSTKKNKQKM